MITIGFSIIISWFIAVESYNIVHAFCEKPNYENFSIVIRNIQMVSNFIGKIIPNIHKNLTLLLVFLSY